MTVPRVDVNAPVQGTQGVGGAHGTSSAKADTTAFERVFNSSSISSAVDTVKGFSWSAVLSSIGSVVKYVAVSLWQLGRWVTGAGFREQQKALNVKLAAWVAPQAQPNMTAAECTQENTKAMARWNTRIEFEDALDCGYHALNLSGCRNIGCLPPHELLLDIPSLKKVYVPSNLYDDSLNTSQTGERKINYVSDGGQKFVTGEQRWNDSHRMAKASIRRPQPLTPSHAPV